MSVHPRSFNLLRSMLLDLWQQQGCFYTRTDPQWLDDYRHETNNKGEIDAKILADGVVQSVWNRYF